MLNLDNTVSNKNENKNNNWPFRMLIIGPSGSGKTNTLLHLINDLHPIDNIQMIWMMYSMTLIITTKIEIK